MDGSAARSIPSGDTVVTVVQARAEGPGHLAIGLPVTGPETIERRAKGGDARLLELEPAGELGTALEKNDDLGVAALVHAFIIGRDTAQVQGSFLEIQGNRVSRAGTCWRECMGVEPTHRRACDDASILKIVPDTGRDPLPDEGLIVSCAR